MCSCSPVSETAVPKVSGQSLTDCWTALSLEMMEILVIKIYKFHASTMFVLVHILCTPK